MIDLKKVTRINEKLYQLSSGLRILSNISWPMNAEREFLAYYRRGQVILPEVHYQKVNYSEKKSGLKRLLKSFTANDPLEVFTKKNIQSYIDAIHLNEAVGSKSFTDLSVQIFGKPGDMLPGSEYNNVEAAEKLIQSADEYSPPVIKGPQKEISAEDIQKYMERRIEGVFHGEGPVVQIVESLAAKATATSKAIKLRAGIQFNKYDFKQLFYHEVMTHALTALNGERQPILKSIGRGAPRSLKTQEGLATFSELITGAMDIHRLKRMGLRIVAIENALNGANFLQTFEYFLSKGQGDSESFSAAHRVFRGGFPDKNIVFTKDCIYLDGLLHVHTFFRWAMKNNRLDLCHLLFCGRLSLEDIFELEEAYHYQWIAPPQFLPAWFAKTDGLAGALSFSLLANLIRIDLTDKEIFRKAA